MHSVTLWIVFFTFAVATLALAVYGIHLYVLLCLFRRRATSRREAQRAIIQKYQECTKNDRWPVVTSQIPIYNESDVSRRVMESVAAMDYPEGHHEIQVLDDSTDGTEQIVPNEDSQSVVTGRKRTSRVGWPHSEVAFAKPDARSALLPGLPGRMDDDFGTIHEQDISRSNVGSYL